MGLERAIPGALALRVRNIGDIRQTLEMAVACEKVGAVSVGRRVVDRVGSSELVACAVARRRQCDLRV